MRGAEARGPIPRSGASMLSMHSARELTAVIDPLDPPAIAEVLQG